MGQQQMTPQNTAMYFLMSNQMNGGIRFRQDRRLRRRGTSPRRPRPRPTAKLERGEHARRGPRGYFNRTTPGEHGGLRQHYARQNPHYPSYGR